MARSDWNQYGSAGSVHSLSTSVVHEGVSALKTDDDETDAFEILGISESDAPAESRVELWANPQASESGFHTFHRFQDTGNLYMLGLYYSDSVGSAVVGLRKIVSGTESVVDETVDQAGGGNFSTVTLSDGRSVDSGWAPYRADLWVDSGGDLRGRITEDADQDGKWTQIGNDVVDTTPDLGSGGGVGIGSYNSSVYGNVVYWDNTEVFY